MAYIIPTIISGCSLKLFIVSAVCAFIMSLAGDIAPLPCAIRIGIILSVVNFNALLADSCIRGNSSVNTLRVLGVMPEVGDAAAAADAPGVKSICIGPGFKGGAPNASSRLGPRDAGGIEEDAGAPIGSTTSAPSSSDGKNFFGLAGGVNSSSRTL